MLMNIEIKTLAGNSYNTNNTDADYTDYDTAYTAYEEELSRKSEKAKKRAKNRKSKAQLVENNLNYHYVWNTTSKYRSKQYTRFACYDKACKKEALEKFLVADNTAIKKEFEGEINSSLLALPWDGIEIEYDLYEQFDSYFNYLMYSIDHKINLDNPYVLDKLAGRDFVEKLKLYQLDPHVLLDKIFSFSLPEFNNLIESLIVSVMDKYNLVSMDLDDWFLCELYTMPEFHRLIEMIWLKYPDFF